MPELPSAAARQCADALLLVRPAAFGFNPETAASNALQSAGAEPAAEIARRALAEFDALVVALRAAGVAVQVADDEVPPLRPDAVFPNNWLSLHRDGTVVLYPMCAPNRRLERRPELLPALYAALGYRESRRIDLAPCERGSRFLEGTGSLVLDHVQRVAYACRSPRTDEALVHDWARQLGYEPLVFDACDPQGRPYYHTNVMLSVGARAVVVALDGVPPAQAALLRARLVQGGRELIEIDAAAVAGFGGNLLEITGRNAAGRPQQYWALSAAACAALGPGRCARLTAGGERLLVVPIPTIERQGGGSVRCMLAEVPRSVAGGLAGQPLPQRLFAALADGEVHSGQALAARLGVSRGGVWKAVEQLRTMGLTLAATRNRGYQLPAPASPLDAGAIAAALAPAARGALRRCEVAWQLGSTNAELLARSDLPVGRSDALLAEYQSAGRGRRGRQWLAPPGGALCLSLSRSFAALPAEASALSLAVGVWVRRALLEAGVAGVGLKWPNDLQVGGAKLGGILIELRAESLGPALVVIGVGLNVALGTAVQGAVRGSGTEPVDLASLGARADRNRLAARLLDETLRGLPEFERQGFAPWREEWRQADVLRGRIVQVSGAAALCGEACGIDADGALLVQTPDGVQRVVAGEVSVRTQQ